VDTPPPNPQELPALIQSLRDSGEAPTPELLEAILAHGPAAVPPLLSFLQEMAEVRDIPARLEEPLRWAAGLASQLGASEAVPLLLTLATRSDQIANDLSDLMGRLGDAARPALLAYLRGESGRPDPIVRDLVAGALGDMGHHPETAAFLIERAGRHLHGPVGDRDLAQMYGYALLTMRAPEARELLDELESSDPEEWFPETEESIAELLRRGPAPPRPVPDVVTLVKHRRAWRALHPGEDPPIAYTYASRPERDPEEQARKRAARQARRATKPSAKPSPKGHSRRR
jgi:hypothetical protein